MSTNTILILYLALSIAFVLVLFCLLFSRFNRNVLSKWSIDSKMLFYTIAITLIMVSLVVYYCKAIENFSVVSYLFLFLIFALYTGLVLLTFYILLKPVRKLQQLTKDLAEGKRNVDIYLEGSKEFEKIEENLLNVQANYRNDDKKLNEKDFEYQKYLPKNYLKLLNKTKVEQMQVGDNIRANITIMFCDVRDSFFTSGTMNLEENFRVISEFLNIVGKEVRKNKGFVDKFMGDGVLAVFEKEEDALKSAYSICEKLEYQNLVTIGVNNIDFGIGVHTGSVIVGVVGENQRKSATIISDAVNLVSRIEHLNKTLHTKILFTKDTLNGLESNNIHYRYVGTMRFDDLTEPIPVFECLDGFKGIKKNALIKTSMIFESAVRQYEKGDMSQAKELFLQVLKNDNDDFLSKYYLSKCNSKMIKQDKK